MNTNEESWVQITRKYFGDAWVENETRVIEQMTKQQKLLPISVAEARAQVLRLKSQSISTIKKGQDFNSK